MSENAVPEEIGASTLDFTGIKIIGFSGGGIQKINGDGTLLQTITGDVQTVIADLGAGAHNISHHAILQVQATPAVIPINVPSGVVTPLLSDVVGNPGLYFVTVNINQTPPLIGSVNARLQILNGAATIGDVSQNIVVTATVNTFGMVAVSYCINFTGGETVSCQLTQDSAGPLAINAVQNIIRLGTFP